MPRVHKFYLRKRTSIFSSSEETTQEGINDSSANDSMDVETNSEDAPATRRSSRKTYHRVEEEEEEKEEEEEVRSNEKRPRTGQQ